MPLNELSNAQLNGNTLQIYSAGYYIARFDLVGISYQRLEKLLEQLKQRIYSSQIHNQWVTPSYSTQTLEKDQPQEEALDQLDETILDIITAYRHSQYLGFQQILELADEEHTISLDLLKLRLTRLISDGHLPGYLTEQGYTRDTFITIHCQICDTDLKNPHMYWQCPNCYRFTCLDCREKSSRCPTHPDVPVELVRMPIRCSNCQTPVSDLQMIKDYTCPACKAAFPPP
jgi:hypothetical protein